MNTASNIITVVKSIVSAMTPVIEITDNQSTGSNWILTACRTYWVVPCSVIEIGGESFTVESIIFNESITVSGAAQPIGSSFQLAAPDFVHGSSRKVDGERKKEDDVTNMFVYLPKPSVSEDNRYDSDISYNASVRPLFLIAYDKYADNTNDQQSNYIDPMNAAADLFETIVNENIDKFDETEFFNREEWMNFGNPSVWGNDDLIFDAPLSGVELNFELIVLEAFACLCDGADPITCKSVSHSFQGSDTGIETSPGGNFNVQVLDQVDAPIGVKESEDANNILVRVNTAGLPVTVENSDVTYDVNVASGGTLILPDITHTQTDGSPEVLPAQTPMVCTPGGTPINVSNAHNTGVTATFIPGKDDGGTQRGRGSGWGTLDFTNPFGNTDRFTDTLGTQLYAEDVVLDWAYYNQISETVYGWKKTLQSPLREDQHVDNQPYTFATYDDWVVPNINELLMLFNPSIINNPLNYPPFNYLKTTDYNRIWSCSRIVGNSCWYFDIAIYVTNYFNAYHTLIKRNYTLTELGL